MVVQLDLSLRGRDLPNVAGLLAGTSDPFAVVTKVIAANTTTGGGESSSTTTTTEILGRTETIINTLNPDWIQVFKFNYEFGTPTKLVVTLFDGTIQSSSGNGGAESDNNNNIKSMGAAIFDVATLLGSRGNTLAKKIRGGGKLYASLRQRSEDGSSIGQLSLQLKADNLTNTEGLGIFNKSDPFYEICRRNDDDSGFDDVVYRSEHIRNNLSPEWKETSTPIDLRTLCDGDFNMPIQIRIYDCDRNGKHDNMGSVETTTRELFNASLTKAGLEVSTGGSIMVSKAKFVDGPTFKDYISGGCQMNVVLAIDFSSSNGDPRQPDSLHYFSQDGTTLNDYEKAIKSIIGVLSHFDSEQKYPVYGFGAKYDGTIQHSFRVGEEDELDGLDGILEAYRNVFSTGLVMSGPTVITEVIDAAAKRAESKLDEAIAAAHSGGSQSYTILVILTDGCVEDMTSTIRCILANNDKPLSIVIVGVGEEDFSQMQILDDLRRKGKRDMVQFVCFNEHRQNPADLTSSTLAEIPNQLESFFHSRGIMPSAPIEAEEGDVVVVDNEEEEQEIDLSLDFSGEDEIVVSGGCNIDIQEEW